MRAERLARTLALALLCAGGLAAAPARALPITLYADVDLGADHVAARERLGASAAAAPLAAAPPAVALHLAAKPKPLASAPLEISFTRWDENGLVSTDVALALAGRRR